MIWLVHDESGLPLYSLGNPALLHPGTLVLELDALPADLAGWRVIDGALVQLDLEPARAAARLRLAAQISAARAALITELPGQQMIYLRKEAEALAYVADPAPDLEDYPMLAAEIGITAPTGWEVAQIWLHMSAAWQEAAASLEALRLSTLAAIDAATTAEALDAITSTIPTA